MNTRFLKTPQPLFIWVCIKNSNKQHLTKYGCWRAAHTHPFIPSRHTNQSIRRGKPITQKDAGKTDQWCVERNVTGQPQICFVSGQMKGRTALLTTALLCLESGLTPGATLSKSDNCPSAICPHYLHSLYGVSSTSGMLPARHAKTKPSHVRHCSSDSEHKAQAKHLFIATHVYFK